MHQLPALVFAIIEFVFTLPVIDADVSGKRAHQEHASNARKEERADQCVADGNEIYARVSVLLISVQASVPCDGF